MTDNLSIACDIVNIRVGHNAMFRVHENVLRQSPFFANALKPEWASEREGKPIDLAEEDPDTIAAYVQWLYTHQVDPAWDHYKWANNYVLGEKMMDREFQDDVLETLMPVCVATKRFPARRTSIRTIYHGTPQGSLARKLVVDVWCSGSPDPEILLGQDPARTVPADFVNDLLVALFQTKADPCARKNPFYCDSAVYMAGSRKKQE